MLERAFVPAGVTVSARPRNETDMNTNIKTPLKLLCAALLGLALAHTNSFAQTDGVAKFEVTLVDYNGAGADHWTVVWVTTSSGTFIKSLRKQGPTITSSHWNSHCPTWYAAKAGSTALDGYSSASAFTYSGTNSPVILTWNCRDASNNLMADGNYKFWVQYAEENNDIEGPFTTGGLLWTKGPAGATNTYAPQGANFTGMRVTWTPAASAVAPTITSAAPPATGIVGVPYSHTCTATGTAPIKFSAVSLPTGLTISTNGVISGAPTAAGAFNGTITATNGTLPNATQPFSIAISVVPTRFTSVRSEGTKLVMSGTGPANGIYAVLTATTANASAGQWTPVVTNSIGAGGSFSYTNTLDLSVARKFYRLRVP
jgi:hypothetical protein